MDLLPCNPCKRVLELEAEVVRLKDEIKRLNERCAEMQGENKDLERKVNMDSSNSSKPPSTDSKYDDRPKSLRKKSGRKQGAQPGHKGNNIIIPHEADVFVEHYPTKCLNCPNLEECKKGSVFSCAEKRSVIDVVITTKVTEHQSMTADCPMGNRNLRGTFPKEVKAVAQYGDTFTSLVGILHSYGIMSYNRITGLIRDLTGTTISEGTAVEMVSKCAETIRPAIDMIRERLLGCRVINSDETGIIIDGILFWLHSTSTPKLVVQTISRKRGVEGIEEHAVLTKLHGKVVVHDFWPAYFSFDVEHAMCCAHILRELRGIEELEPDHLWPINFAKFLLSLKSLKEAAIERGLTSFDIETQERIHERYRRIMELADKECPSPPKPAIKKKGKPKKGVERSLIERLQKYEENVSFFAYDFEVPFDNNLAERDVRYVKVKMKVSGQYRDIEHAQASADIFSFINTARKNGVSAYNALTAAFKGKYEVIFGQTA